MKNSARSVSAFFLSSLGSFALAIVGFLLFSTPCPEILPGIANGDCVGSMTLEEFAKWCGGAAIVLGLLALAISESMTDKA